MTKEEVQAFLKKLGIYSVKATDAIAEKVEAAKAELDTETRRRVRSFWIVVSAFTFVVGLGVGSLL